MAYDPAKDLYVHTDASGFAVGGWLGQPADPDDKIPSPLPTTMKGLGEIPRLRPVTFFAKKMIPAETRYPVHEQELLAIVKCFEANRHYLIGRHFRCFTDHKSLTWINKQPNLSRRQAAWVEKLQEYDCSLEYLPGEANTVADVLSRQAVYAPKCATCQRKVEVEAAVIQAEDPARSEELTQSLDPRGTDWKEACDEDDFYHRVVAGLAETDESGKPRVPSSQYRRYRIDEGVLYYEDKLYVPERMRKYVLAREHDTVLRGGHSGDNRTLAKLLPKYYWPNVVDTVIAYIRSCDSCQKNRAHVKQPGFMRSLPIPAERWSQIGLDIAFLPGTTSYHGRRGQPVKLDAVLVLVDYLSSRAVFVPTTRDATAEELATLYLTHVYKNFGTPKTIVCDRDPKWLSKFWVALMHLIGTKQAVATARHQNTNGKVERLIKTLKAMLKAYLNHAGSNWVDLLPLLEFNYNSTPNGSGVSPFEIDTLRVPRDGAWEKPPQGSPATIAELKDAHDAVALVVQQTLRDAQDRQEKIVAHKRKHQAFQVGDEVLLWAEGLNVSSVTTLKAKLAKAWVGPFKVKAVHDFDNYELDLAHEFTLMHPVFHTSQLKAYDRREPAPVVVPKLVRGEKEWPAESILEYNPRTRKYLVKWVGHDESQNTWESRAHVAGTTALEEFEKRTAEEAARVPREPRKRRASTQHEARRPERRQGEADERRRREASPPTGQAGAGRASETRRDPRNTRETRSMRR
jgi:hypothetical protein